MKLPIPDMVLALGLAVLVAAILSLLAGPRGGRYRALPGWIGFWALLSMMLVCLSNGAYLGHRMARRSLA